MATRRAMREWILQLLFQLEFNPSDDLNRVFGEFWRSHQKADTGARRFVEAQVQGVRMHLRELDAVLQRLATYWQIERMGSVERNVMRMALYEMLYCPDIPPIVSINEAVDIAKYFSSDEAGKFVNGILDQARKELATPHAKTA